MASIPGLDDDTKAALGQHLTEALAAHTGQDSDAVAEQAGTSTDEVASGDPGALQKIIAYGQQHPEILASATQAFTERNPAALEAMVPAIMGFFK
jgi:ABC-type nitrate/sulfonate/bicarbonate transport system substrate-binding protein